MNRKQFIILLLLVVVIGAAGLAIRKRDQSSWQSTGQSLGQKLLPSLSVNDVAQISIQSGTNELNLVKSGDLWRVRERGDYPANFPDISSLLIKLADLKIVQIQDVGASQLGRFELLPPTAEKNAGTLVGLKDQNGKVLATILLGKKHMSKSGEEGWPDGRYVMTTTDGKSAALISDSLENVQPKPEQWLNKDFLSIEKPRSIAVQFSDATNSWKLTRASETNDWQLAAAKPDEKLDASKLSAITGAFSSASFNDVSLPSTTNATNAAVINVETLDGFKYLANIGQKENENYPVHFSITADIASDRIAAPDEKAEDKSSRDKEFKDRQAKLAEKFSREKQFTNWVYQIPAYTIDSVIKRRADLMAEAKKETASNDGK